MQVILWTICISLFVTGIVLGHFSIAQMYAIFGEVNSQLPEERRVSPIFASGKVLSVIQMHREMFPASRRPKKLWLFWIAATLAGFASFGMLIIMNIGNLAGL